MQIDESVVTESAEVTEGEVSMKAEPDTKSKETDQSAKMDQSDKQDIPPEEENVVHVELTIPEEDAKKTLFPCKYHKSFQYFNSHEDLTRHFIEEHWGVTEDSIIVHPNEIKRGRGRPKGSKGRGKGRPPLSARPGITPDEEAAAVAMSVMRHSKLSWSRQKIIPAGGKGVRCQHCYKPFATQLRLEMHVARTHTAERMKPVPCKACGKQFRNQVQCRNHFRIVHEGKKRIFKKPYNWKPKDRKLFICDVSFLFIYTVYYCVCLSFTQLKIISYLCKYM